MTYKEDLEYSIDALEEAIKSIEYAIVILPLVKHIHEVQELRNALKIVRDTKLLLRSAKTEAEAR